MTSKRVILALTVATLVAAGLTAVGIWGELKVSASQKGVFFSPKNSILKIDTQNSHTLITLIGYDTEGKLLDCQSKAAKIELVEVNLKEGFASLDQEPQLKFVSGDCQSTWQFEIDKPLDKDQFTVRVLDEKNNQYLVSSL